MHLFLCPKLSIICLSVAPARSWPLTIPSRETGHRLYLLPGMGYYCVYCSTDSDLVWIITAKCPTLRLRQPHLSHSHTAVTGNRQAEGQLWSTCRFGESFWIAGGPRGDGITTSTTWIQQVQPGPRKVPHVTQAGSPVGPQPLVVLVIRTEMESTTPLPTRALPLCNQSI